MRRLDKWMHRKLLDKGEQNMKHLTLKEAYEVIKKYDRDLYNYYEVNAECFGCDAIRYAEYLLRKHEGEEK